MTGLESFYSYFMVLILSLYSVKKISEKLLVIISGFFIISISLLGLTPNYFIGLCVPILFLLDRKLESIKLVDVVFIYFIFNLESPNLILISYLAYYVRLVLGNTQDKAVLIRTNYLFWIILLGIFGILVVDSFNYIDQFSYYFYVSLVLILRSLFTYNIIKLNQIENFVQGTLLPLYMINFISIDDVGSNYIILLIILAFLSFEFIKRYKNFMDHNYLSNIVFIFTVGFLLLTGGEGLLIALIVNSLVFYITNNGPDNVKYLTNVLLHKIKLLIISIIIFSLFKYDDSSIYILQLILAVLIITPPLLWKRDNNMLVDSSSQLLKKINPLEMVIVAFIFIVMTIAVKILI